jgi:hypothetical protein
MTRRIALVVAVVLAGSSPASAQEEGRIPFVARLPVGARALALGGATAAIRDPDVLFGNPALAGTSTSTTLSLARYRDAASAGSVASSSPYGRIGIAVGVLYLDSSRDALIVAPISPHSGSLTSRGDIPAASLAAMVAGSMTFKGYRFGVGAKYSEERADNERGSVVLADIGASKDFALGTVGLVVQNLGRSIRTSDGDLEPATRVALSVFGGSQPLNPYVDLAASVGIAVLGDGFVAGSVGAELNWVPIEGVGVALRQGIRRAELAEQRPYTGGVGFALDRMVVDYAWEQLRRGGGHRISIRIR